jgi:hypothetical protein
MFKAGVEHCFDFSGFEAESETHTIIRDKEEDTIASAL